MENSVRIENLDSGTGRESQHMRMILAALLVERTFLASIFLPFLISVIVTTALARLPSFTIND